MEGSGQGIFDWDIISDWVFLSVRAQQLLGLEAGESRRLRLEWAQLVRHPSGEAGDDCGRDTYVLAGGAIGDVEFRVLTEGGLVRWLRQRW